MIAKLFTSCLLPKTLTKENGILIDPCQNNQLLSTSQGMQLCKSKSLVLKETSKLTHLEIASFAPRESTITPSKLQRK